MCYHQARVLHATGLILLVVSSSRCATTSLQPAVMPSQGSPARPMDIPAALVQEVFTPPEPSKDLTFLRAHPDAEPKELLEQAQQSWLLAEDQLKKAGKWYPRLQALEESVIYYEQALLRLGQLASCQNKIDCLLASDLPQIRPILPMYAVTLLSFATARGLDTFFIYKARLESIATLLQQSDSLDQKAYSAYIRGYLLSQLPSPLGGDVTQAKVYLEQAIAQQPDNPLFYLVLAEQLALQINDMTLFVTSLQQASQRCVTWQQGILGQRDVIASKSAYLLAHVQDFF